MKISILLPYKENFSPNYAGAVSLFVKDTTIKSKYTDKIFIYGNTNYKKKLLKKNYINLDLNKKFYQSSSKLYVESFLNYEKNLNSDLIEVHNRPHYIRYIKNKTICKLVLYFHNDPLTMNGSKSVLERNYLLKNVDKLIFNSKWSMNRFFIGMKNIEKYSNVCSIIHQSASKVNINFSKKKKIISFIGKLNSAKGYDLFGSAVVKILDKYPDWKAIVLGDEPREKLNFVHKNLKNLGFKNHNYVLNLLKYISISVICSRWNEPFGRTSLEASSRGCAVIISNRGGLPETTDHAIVLKNLSQKEIFNKIEYLIRNPSIREKFQKRNLLNFKYTHNFISNLLDDIRTKFLNLSNIRKSFFSNKQIYKILHITNFNDRYNGRLHYNTGRRINNGFIRLGHNVLSISDRDIINKSKSINDFNGIKTLNSKIIEISDNFKPDVIVIGHADAVKRSTFNYLKNKNKSLKIAQWFLDPVSKNGPDFIKNKNRILDKIDFIDANFLTTDPLSLSFKLSKSFFIPNPCDHSFEVLNNFKHDLDNDIFFAMSHGVHRGHLKKGKIDDREIFINRLIENNNNIKFDIYGMNNIQPIWAEKFIEKVSNCNMGLNLSRGIPIKYYSSDRISQLMGNGLLTFIDERTQFDDFLGKKEIVTYKNASDLEEKIMKYKKDNKSRKIIAKNGKEKYFKYFNSDLVAEYILSKTFNIKTKNKFIWNK